MVKFFRNTQSATDSDRYFRTDYLTADIKNRSVRGGAVTMATQTLKFGLTLLSNVVLARLLTPQDYGLIGMVTAVIGLVGLFKDLGLSMATVQKADINHKQVSTLFWVNVGVSIVVMLITIALAPAVAWFYKEPRLIGITIALASAFIFGGLTVQHQALLNRQMRFTALAIVDLTSITLGIAAAIVSAWYEASYWALVVMQLVMAIANAIGVWIACGWRPGLPARQSGVRSMLAFGGNLTAFNFVNYFARNLDNVLIGWYWGAQQLGLYAKAYQLLLLPIQQLNAPITAVAIPALSRLQQEPQQFRQYYLKAVSLITFLTTPLAILMLAMAEEIISIMLGSQWRDAATIFRFLGISVLVQPINNTTGWLYISRGKTDRMFKWGMFTSSILVGSFFVGLPYGAKGVALCYAIAVVLLSWPGVAYATRGTSILAVDVFLTAQKPLLVSLLAVIPYFSLKYWFGNQMPTVILTSLSISLMATLYLLISFYILGMKEEYLSILKTIKKK